MITDWTTEIVEVDGARIELRKTGHDDPLLVLHGPWGNSDLLGLSESLAAEFEIYLPAHPGFGGSECPSWLDSMADMVSYYIDFMDQLNFQRLALMGFSLGGWLAAELAATWPEKITKLVLVDAAGLRIRQAGVADIFMLPGPELMQLCFFDAKSASGLSELFPDDPGPAEIELQGRNQTMAQRLAWKPYMHNPKLPYRLKRLQMPVLLVWGKQDGIVPLCHGEAYARQIPNAELKVIERCGHVPHLERPKEFGAMVREFLLKR
jgi:pimeloyl-ACP methyl ester carboxylesterase